jgi:hypothetical protein
VPDRGARGQGLRPVDRRQLTLIELTIDGGPPRHTHTRKDESFHEELSAALADADTARVRTLQRSSGIVR